MKSSKKIIEQKVAHLSHLVKAADKAGILVFINSPALLN